MKRSILKLLPSVRASLRWKTIVICLLLLIVPILTIGWSSYNTAKQELDKLGKTNLQDNVEMILKLIDAYQIMVDNGTITLEEAQEQVRIRAVGPKKEDGKTRTIEHKIGETGYMFALDAKGIDVMHPTREGQNLWESKDSDGVLYIQEIIKNGTLEGGFSYYYSPLPGSDEIAKKVTYSQMDPHWGWIVASGSYLQDFNKSSEGIKKTMLEIILVFSVAGVIIALLFARHITAPIRKITDQVERMAAGDLALDELKIRNRDEVGRLATHFNHMKEQMQLLIGNVSRSAEQVAATGEELLAGSEETGKATEQITLAIQEVASGAHQQAEIVMEIFELVSLAEKGMQEMARESETASASSMQASSAADTGKRVLAETLEHMKLIEEKVKRLEAAIHTLEHKSSSIGDIISLITNIALQTNILALNAGIEASRAGEQGKGFAVVATEVKKLAEQTRQAADQVGQLIHEVQSEVSEAAVAMQEESTAVAAGLRLAEEAEDSFRGVTTSVDDVVVRCREVALTSGDVTIRMSSLVSAVEQIAAISTQSSAQSEGVAASAEEQNASMEEIAAAANHLSKMADELQQAVSTFRISGKS